MSLVRSKLPNKAVHKLVTEAYRYTGKEALAADLVNDLGVSGDEVISKAKSMAELVAPLSKTGVSMFFISCSRF